MFYLDNTNSNTYIYFTLSLSYPKIFFSTKKFNFRN